MLSECPVTGVDLLALRRKGRASRQSGSDTSTSAICDCDYGGPLVVGGRIVGVASWGRYNDCVAQGDYSVFTKMSAFLGTAYPQIDDTRT
jgi:secreted trypsin-like serine protease